MDTLMRLIIAHQNRDEARDSRVSHEVTVEALLNELVNGRAASICSMRSRLRRTASSCVRNCARTAAARSAGGSCRSAEMPSVSAGGGMVLLCAGAGTTPWLSETADGPPSLASD